MSLLNAEPGFGGELKSDFEKMIIAERLIVDMDKNADLLKDHILYLEDKCKELNKKIAQIVQSTPKERAEAKKMAFESRSNKKTQKLERIIAGLRNSNNELIMKMNSEKDSEWKSFKIGHIGIGIKHTKD